MAEILNDLSIVFYTSNVIPDKFADYVRTQLVKAAGEIPIVSVSKQPMSFGLNVCVGDTPRNQYNIYKQALAGAKVANTPYIAMCEDDVLYSPEHFKFRPKPQHWGYNMNPWSIFTWGEPMFSYKAPGGRRNLNSLICERQLFIDHLEERFSKWTEETYDINIFGEPGKYDNQLGTMPYPSQDFYTNPPNIVFSHQTNLQFAGLGTRKGMGQIRAYSIPYWGDSDYVRSIYE